MTEEADKSGESASAKAAKSAPAPATPTAPPAPAETPGETEEGWKPPRSRGRIMLFGALILIGALAILYAWGLPPFRPSSQTTDNAYVRGQTTIIAPQVGGYVTAVLVQDFQRVKAGEVLARIDDRIYRQRVAQGHRNIAAQSASLGQ